MFYAALALLQKIGKAPSKHTGVISFFDTEFVKKGVFEARFSKDFHQAFSLRQHADYRIMETPSLTEAEEMYQRAERFVAAIKKYLLP
jgi:uncharacterized protein (UPF0332 family)